MHRALTLFTSGVAIMVYSRWKKSSLGGRVGARERLWQRSELMEIELPSNFCCYVRALRLRAHACKGTRDIQTRLRILVWGSTAHCVLTLSNWS